MPYLQKVQPPKLRDFSEWYRDIIKQMHELRPSLHTLSEKQYKIFHDTLVKNGGVSAGDRVFAEGNILHSKWSAAKLTGIGLELSDFFPPEVTLSRAEILALQQRMLQLAKFAVEERQREAERLRDEQEKLSPETAFEKTVNSYKKMLIQYHSDRDVAERKTEKAIRRAERAESDADTMRSLIAQKDAEMQEYLDAAQTVSEEEIENPEYLRTQVRFLTKKNDVLTRELQSAVYGAQRGEDDDFDIDTLFKAR